MTWLYAFQFAAPLILIGWLAWVPARSGLGFVLQVFGSAAALFVIQGLLFIEAGVVRGRLSFGLRKDCKHWIGSMRWRCWALMVKVYFNAALLRAKFRLKTPDTLHPSCAQFHRCASLWNNNDQMLKTRR